MDDLYYIMKSYYLLVRTYPDSKNTARQIIEKRINEERIYTDLSLIFLVYSEIRNRNILWSDFKTQIYSG